MVIYRTYKITWIKKYICNFKFINDNLVSDKRLFQKSLRSAISVELSYINRPYLRFKIKKPWNQYRNQGFLVVPPGIEPGTHGFSVHCSTIWAKVPIYFLTKIRIKNPVSYETGFFKERRRHTLPHNCSTICAGGLNYSVRDGKRWAPPQ